MCHSRLEELIAKQLEQHHAEKAQAFEQECLSVYVGEKPQESSVPTYADALQWVLTALTELKSDQPAQTVSVGGLKLLLQSKVNALGKSVDTMYELIEVAKNAEDWESAEHAYLEVQHKLSYTEALAWVLMHLESDVAPEAGLEPTTK